MVALQRAFADLADLGVHGAVVGFAREALDLDLDRIGAGRRPRPSVRCIVPSIRSTIEAAIDAALAFPQIDRILTSGGSGNWTERCERLTEWARRAGPRISILPGGGLDEQALGCARKVPRHRRSSRRQGVKRAAGVDCGGHGAAGQRLEGLLQV